MSRYEVARIDNHIQQMTNVNITLWQHTLRSRIDKDSAPVY